MTEAARPDEPRSRVGHGGTASGSPRRTRDAAGSAYLPLLLRARRHRGVARLRGPAQDRHRLRALQSRVRADRRRARRRLLRRPGDAVVDAQPSARHQISVAGHRLSHRDRSGDSAPAARRADARAARLQGRGGASRCGGRERDGAGAALRVHALRPRAAEGDRSALRRDRGGRPDALRDRDRRDPHRREACTRACAASSRGCRCFDASAPRWTSCIATRACSSGTPTRIGGCRSASGRRSWR